MKISWLYMPFSPSASLISALLPVPLSKLSPMEFYLCPPPGMWCLSRSQLRPWRLPAYQRGPRCMVGSLWSPWKSRLSEGRAARPSHKTVNTLYQVTATIIAFCVTACMCVVPTYLSLYDGPQQLQDSMSGLRWLLQRQHILHSFPYCLHCVLKNTNRFDKQKKFVVHCQKYPGRNSRLTSSNFFVLARSQTWFIMRMRLLRPQSGWSSWKRN